MAIIAITQYPGTRAIELGHLLSDRLGYRFLTADDLIAIASRIYGVTPEQAVIADERRPHFWERLKTDTQRFVPLFRAVALKEMARGRVILYGRSVGHLMPDYGQCLRVRPAGPIKARVAEVMREENLTSAAAERRVRDYDREVRARIQTLFDVDLEDPAAHHLTINTFATPMPVLTDMLTLAVEELDQMVTPEQRGQLQDTALAAQVRAALLGGNGDPVQAGRTGVAISSGFTSTMLTPSIERATSPTSRSHGGTRPGPETCTDPRSHTTSTGA